MGFVGSAAKALKSLRGLRALRMLRALRAARAAKAASGPKIESDPHAFAHAGDVASAVYAMRRKRTEAFAQVNEYCRTDVIRNGHYRAPKPRVLHAQQGGCAPLSKSLSRRR